MLARVCTALLVTLLLPASAGAVLTGVITTTRNRGEVHVAAPGFQLDAAMLNGFFPGGCLGTIDPVCPPGTQMGLNLFSSASDVVGTLVTDGMTFGLGQQTSPAFVIIQTNGSVLLPPIDTTATLSAPFTFSISAFTDRGQPLADFSGDGIASVNVRSINFLDGRWEFVSATFPINPVPEPSTLFLMAAGAIAMGRRVARRRYRGSCRVGRMRARDDARSPHARRAACPGSRGCRAARQPAAARGGHTSSSWTRTSTSAPLCAARMATLAHPGWGDGGSKRIHLDERARDRERCRHHRATVGCPEVHRSSHGSRSVTPGETAVRIRVRRALGGRNVRERPAVP